MRTHMANKARMHADIPAAQCSCPDCAPAPVDPVRAAVAADPAVQSTAKALERAQARYEAADEKWIDTIRQAREVEIKAQNAPVLYDRDMMPLAPSGHKTAVAQRRALDERAGELRQARDKASQAVNEARREHDAATRAAWRVAEAH